jgi:hypothetical protein
LEHDLFRKDRRWHLDHAEGPAIPGSCGSRQILRPRRNLTAESANRLFNDTKQSWLGPIIDFRAATCLDWRLASAYDRAGFDILHAG